VCKNENKTYQNEFDSQQKKLKKGGLKQTHTCKNMHLIKFKLAKNINTKLKD
jgi:hypothetical protein